MATCFVIQPFDKSGPYDKRYRDVLKPAIEAAGLTAYRVDEDPGTTVLIEDIEKGIRDSEVCLADITTNNPNIWYEVGFAIANGKPTVLICADPRAESFPFDIRHRHIINYRLHSSSDFDALKVEVIARLRAQAKKAETLQTVATMSEMQTTEGLSAHEISVMVAIMSERSTREDGLAPYVIKNKMRSSGYTAIAVGLAMETLFRKGMIEYFQDNNYDGQFTSTRLTERGVNWLLANQDRFYMRRDENTSRSGGAPASAEITDEDIPF
jgi:nucleoside 2-deoxyribosyltransferase